MCINACETSEAATDEKQQRFQKEAVDHKGIAWGSACLALLLLPFLLYHQRVNKSTEARRRDQETQQDQSYTLNGQIYTSI